MFDSLLFGGIDPYRLMIIVGVLVLIWSFANGGLDGVQKLVKDLVAKVQSVLQPKPKPAEDLVIVLNDEGKPEKVSVPTKPAVVVKAQPDVVEVVREWQELRDVAENAQLSDAVAKLDDLFATLNKPVEVKQTTVVVGKE